MKLQHDSRNCPHCDADLQGKPIPQEHRDAGYYPAKLTHFSRLIGVSDPVKDRVTSWMCPDCGARDAR